MFKPSKKLLQLTKTKIQKVEKIIAMNLISSSSFKKSILKSVKLIFIITTKLIKITNWNIILIVGEEIRLLSENIPTNNNKNPKIFKYIKFWKKSREQIKTIIPPH